MGPRAFPAIAFTACESVYRSASTSGRQRAVRDEVAVVRPQQKGFPDRFIACGGPSKGVTSAPVFSEWQTPSSRRTGHHVKACSLRPSRFSEPVWIISTLVYQELLIAHDDPIPGLLFPLWLARSFMMVVSSFSKPHK
jgi:hypothetical protein